MILYVNLDMDQISEGYVILFTGLLIVFGSLVLLSLIFKYGIPFLLYTYKIVKRILKGKKIKNIKLEVDEDFTGEVTAAIAMAIHLYRNEQHDHENPILTIKKAKKMYSPWSSKIYGTYQRLNK